MSTPAYIFDHRAGGSEVSCRIEGLIGVGNVYQVMGDYAALFKSWFCRPDFHAAVNLHRIGVYYLGRNSGGHFD
jgi:hypothetical protein